MCIRDSCKSDEEIVIGSKECLVYNRVIDQLPGEPLGEISVVKIRQFCSDTRIYIGLDAKHHVLHRSGGVSVRVGHRLGPRLNDGDEGKFFRYGLISSDSSPLKIRVSGPDHGMSKFPYRRKSPRLETLDGLIGPVQCGVWSYTRSILSSSHSCLGYALIVRRGVPKFDVIYSIH